MSGRHSFPDKSELRLRLEVPSIGNPAIIPGWTTSWKYPTVFFTMGIKTSFGVFLRNMPLNIRERRITNKQKANHNDHILSIFVLKMRNSRRKTFWGICHFAIRPEADLVQHRFGVIENSNSKCEFLFYDQEKICWW